METAFSDKEEVFKNKNDDDLVATFKKWHEAAKKARQSYDWQWYLYDHYYRGNHYIRYNRKTQELITPPRPKNQVRLVVNKIYSTLRAIRNFMTSYRPKWDVTAESTTEDVINNAQKSSEALDFYYYFLKMDKLSKDVAMYTLKYGIGYFQYGWNEEAKGLDNQEGEVEVWVRDPFDVFLDPAGFMTGDIQNCRFIDIATSVPIQDITNNKHYDVKNEDVQADTDKAASSFKNILLSKQMQIVDGDSDELGTKIVHETWYKKLVKNEVQVWVASWYEGKLLRNEETEFTKYNLVPVASDNNPNEVYGESYIKNIIPINKVLNRLESQIVEYNNMVNRGRFISDKDAGVSKITNETGEILEKQSGSEFREVNHASLSPDIHRQIERLNSYLQEIPGTQDAFLGKVPEGVKAGVALESLKVQTANNLQDIKDNLESALAELGQGILELISMHYLVSRMIQSKAQGGDSNNFKIKGQAGVTAGQKIQENEYIIGKQNQVRVIIGSGLAFTREGKITRLDKLLEQGIIDPQTYLEHLEFGNIKDIMQRRDQEQFNQAMMEGVKQGRYQPGQGVVPPEQPQGNADQTPQGQDDWFKLAEDENMAMMNGEDIPGTEGAPKKHTIIHIQYSQSEEAQQDDDLLTRLLQHIKEEETMQGAPTAGGI